MTGPLGILQVSGLLKIHLPLGACRPSKYNVCPRQPQLLQQVFVSSLDHGWLHREMVTLDISGIASILAIDFTSVMTASGNGFAIQSFQIFYMSWCWHSVLGTNPFHAESYRNKAFHFWSLENQIVLGKKGGSQPTNGFSVISVCWEAKSARNCILSLQNSTGRIVGSTLLLGQAHANAGRRIWDCFSARTLVNYKPEGHLKG